MDYTGGDRTSIGISVRWTHFGALTHDVVWAIVRSYEPVPADGVTDFSGEVTFHSPVTD